MIRVEVVGNLCRLAGGNGPSEALKISVGLLFWCGYSPINVPVVRPPKYADDARSVVFWYLPIFRVLALRDVTQIEPPIVPSVAVFMVNPCRVFACLHFPDDAVRFIIAPPDSSGSIPVSDAGERFQASVSFVP